MMVKPPAYKLPHLLALLPKGGRNALVRQVDWPENSFYKITRTKLKFRDGQDDTVQAGGKAWGMLFWKGKLVPPRKNAPAPKIAGGLKHLWAEVPATKLSAEITSVIAEGEKKVAEMTEASQTEMAQRRNARLEARKVYEAAKVAERNARLEAAHMND